MVFQSFCRPLSYLRLTLFLCWKARLILSTLTSGKITSCLEKCKEYSSSSPIDADWVKVIPEAPESHRSKSSSFIVPKFVLAALAGLSSCGEQSKEHPGYSFGKQKIQYPQYVHLIAFSLRQWLWFRVRSSQSPIEQIIFFTSLRGLSLQGLWLQTE